MAKRLLADFQMTFEALQDLGLARSKENKYKNVGKVFFQCWNTQFPSWNCITQAKFADKTGEI